MVVLPRLVSVKRSEAGTLSRFLDFGLLRFDFFGLRCFGAECCVLIAECFFPGCVREGERLLSITAMVASSQGDLVRAAFGARHTGRCPLGCGFTSAWYDFVSFERPVVFATGSFCRWRSWVGAGGRVQFLLLSIHAPETRPSRLSSGKESFPARHIARG